MQIKTFEQPAMDLEFQIGQEPPQMGIEVLPRNGRFLGRFERQRVGPDANRFAGREGVLAAAEDFGVADEAAVHSQILDPGAVAGLAQDRLLPCDQGAGQDQRIAAVAPDRDLFAGEIGQRSLTFVKLVEPDAHGKS